MYNAHLIVNFLPISKSCCIQVYNEIDIFFKFKTSEENGLILYNAGKKKDYIAVELVKGHIQYTLNMG